MTPNPLVQIRSLPQRRLPSIPLFSAPPDPTKQPSTSTPVLAPRRRTHLPHLRSSPSLLFPLLRSSDIKVPHSTKTPIVQPLQLPIPNTTTSSIRSRPSTKRVRRKLNSNPRSLLALKLTDVPRERSTSPSFGRSSGDGDDAWNSNDEGDSGGREDGEGGSESVDDESR